MTRPIFVATLLFVTSMVAADDPPPTLVIEHVAVFDAEAAKMLTDRTIVIAGERILSVGDAAAAAELPAAVRRIDGRGKYAIPGLIDAHVHLVHILDFAHMTGDEVLPLYLAAGVTSIRSTGDEIIAATLVARFAQAHPQSSPRVFTCSPLLDADPPIHRDVGRAVTDVRQVPPLLDELQRWNVATIKIYARTGRDVGQAIIDEGHRRGLFVTAHLGTYPAQQAVDDGIDGLEHIWSVFNYSFPPDGDRTPGYRGRIDLTNPVCESLVAELARKKIFVDPTLVVFRNMILLCDVPDVQDHPHVKLAPQRLRDFWPTYLRNTGCPQGGSLADRRAEFAKFLQLTGKLYRAGVPILAGTDAPEPQVTPGFSLHEELELLVESGLPPAAALQAATWNNAAALRQTANLGSIAPGKLADIVLLDADPLADIRHARRIAHIVRGGQLCSPANLLQQVPKN